MTLKSRIWLDPIRRLQNNLNRWLDPNVGRWVSEDPIGFAGGDGNLMRYVGNRATAFVDQLGLSAGTFDIDDILFPGNPFFDSEDADPKPPCPSFFDVIKNDGTLTDEPKKVKLDYLPGVGPITPPQ